MASDLSLRVRASIDVPAPGTEVSSGTVRVEGWVLDHAHPLRAAIMAGDGTTARVTMGLPRGDIAAAFPEAPHAAACGVRCDVDLRAAAPGPCNLSLVVQVQEGHWHEAASTYVNVSTAPSPAARRPAAAFTIAKDEPVMLPLWVDYYSRYFAADDLFVLDHDSADGSTTAVAERCHVVPIHRDLAFDHRWLRGTVEAFQAFLLCSYETVLFAEVDEFLVADPARHRGLDGYIESLERPAARCVGFNVVHQAQEPALRFDEPILAQRARWHPSLRYNKRLISRIPLRWTEGFHEELNAPDDPPDPSLMLVHLHRVDYDWCLARHRASAARRWSQEDIVRQDGAQNRIDDPVEFEEWFRRGPDLDAPPEFIPHHVRSVL